MMNSSLEALEVKVAFLEDAISQLSDEFYAQQKEMLTLKAQQQRLLNRLQDAQSGDDSAPEASDERPPHY